MGVLWRLSKRGLLRCAIEGLADNIRYRVHEITWPVAYGLEHR
jgi:hypothetical protein